MQTDRPIEAGFSADGYITDQSCFAALRYRGMAASVNGCGWVAAYDLCRYFGAETDPDAVRRELESLHRIPKFPGPTTVRVMRRYLSGRLPGLRETAGREAAVRAAASSRAGIFRYREGREPHYVCFLRQEDGCFRFFNVTDGLEDCRLSMADFAAAHLRGAVRAFTVAEDAP